MSASQLIANRFEIKDLKKDLLGRGGMGDVYRATDTQTGEPVAVKALNPGVVVRDPDILERFVREGEALRQLNHPNIVKVVAAIEERGQHYLVIEYVEGGSLQDLLATQGPLPGVRVVEIALDLADALTRAHRLGIIHRDIKPANVLLAEDGTPRLTDFGMAKVADSPRLTQTGMLVGTVDYLSPEACNGEPLDERADIWAFGVMLYEMLTGERPFRGKTLSATLTAILTQPVPDLAQLAAGISDALIDLVYRMLEKDRQQRIPSVRLVGAELEAILKGREVPTPVRLAPGETRFAPPTPPAQTPSFLGKGEPAERSVKDKLDQKKRSVVIRTPEHRLRVFVSSALKEMAEEREAVRQSVLKLRLAPVMFESGARPHPAQKLYQAYLSQSHIFIGIYWQSYGWIAPGMQISGLEDEYNLSAKMPRLIYIKNPAPNREPALTNMLKRIKNEDASSYKYFTIPDELRELVENDLILLLTEYFETARSEEQAPGEATQPPLTNVPIPRNPLIGREQELATAYNLLTRDDVALVTLTGPGGTGKSRLGIQIALELRDRFTDGVYLVALESISDPDLVIPTIAKTLGVTETAGGPPLAESLKGYLCNKQMLLLLDNFEQVLAAAPQIAELLEACPRAKILTTSRAPLHLRAEKELPVPPLAVPPLKEAPDLQPLSQYSAVQLFIQRAQGVKPDFQVTNENAPAVAEICHRLDGLPLAIELASARIKMLSPQALLTRLEHRFEVLRGGTRDLPERQYTLYSAIDWSYNLLNEDEKRLLRRLSVFVGGWTFEAAEAVCNAGGAQRIEVFDGLEILVDNNLLKLPEEVDGEPRLRMLETIREFAHERLTASGEADAIHHRHAQYYLSLAERAETEMRQSAQVWYRRLEAELDNLRGAMGWTLEQSQNEFAVRIAMALWIFWWIRGYRREGLQWLERGLASTGAIPEAVRAKALNRAGFLARDLGDYARAVVMLQESLALWRQIDDQAGIALSLDKLGTTVMRQGDYAGATEMLEEALKLRRQLGDQHGTYATLNNLGLAASWQGHNERAIELYSESLALARAAEDDHTLGIILTNLGEVYAHQGNGDRAEACYAEAALIYQKLGNRAGEADVTRNRGILALKEGYYAQAFDLLVESILAFLEMDDMEYTILAIEGLAAVAEEQHYPERAARLFSASESLRKVVGVARTPVDQLDYDACLTGVRGELGEAAFTAAWAEGSTMAFEQVVAYAVDRSDQV